MGPAGLDIQLGRRRGGPGMEVTITADTLILLAELLSALGIIGGVILWCFKFVQRSRRQNEELKAIRREQTLICYGLLACLKGLKEQGCNGPVTEAMNRIEEHLNQAAHDEGT